MRKKLWMGILLLAILLTGCGQEKTARKTGLVMDTVATLTATGKESEQAVTEGMQRLKEIETMTAATGSESDLQKLADAAGTGAWVPLHSEVFHILEVSQEYSRKSGGAWDITTGPLVRLWGIGTDKARVPSPTEIAAAKAKTGWQKLALQPETQSARLEEAGMSIDLGGIAKGFALDEVRKIYEKHGIQNGLINLGASSLYAMGKNDAGTEWRIGIRDPRSEDKEAILAVARISDQALSTSGDYERYFEQDGVRYHHILDPRTGSPAKNGIRSDTIVVDGSLPDAGMLSDLLTTTVFVLGEEKGKDFLESLPSTIQGMLCDQQINQWVTKLLQKI